MTEEQRLCLIQLLTDLKFLQDQSSCDEYLITVKTFPTIAKALIEQELGTKKNGEVETSSSSLIGYYLELLEEGGEIE